MLSLADELFFEPKRWVAFIKFCCLADGFVSILGPFILLTNVKLIHVHPLNFFYEQPSFLNLADVFIACLLAWLL